MATRRELLATLLGTAWPGARALAGAAVTDETWRDTSRQRDVPVKLRWPDPTVHPGPSPVLIFSHGLGGTTEGGSVWGQAWTAAGFVVLHLQHPGSDLEAVRGLTDSFRDQRALRQLAGPMQLLARLRDVGFALDEVGRRHAAGQGRWGKVRPERIGLSGHSFGAHTTLGMAGQRYPGFDGIAEPRLAAFIAFSPTPPVIGDARLAFERITRPLLSVTGTRDADVVGVGATAQRRMAVFSYLPPPDKAQLVLQDADHMTFAGQTGRAVEIIDRAQVTRDLQGTHHALVAAITTDWWLAMLLDDAAARARLATPQGLGPGDVWERT